MIAGTTTRPPSSLHEDQFFGAYRIVRAIGAGGMGEVYEAVHEPSGRRLALKVISRVLDSETNRKRFLREGRLAASVSHPNTVYIFGSEEIENRPVIAMELVAAGTLEDRVRAEGPLPPAQAVAAILQVIDGLESAASIGVLHRDVKPANCFVDLDGTVKVGDFGLSISAETRPDSMLTAVGVLLGTPSFSSPEQLIGEPLEVTSDIYGVGATLYCLLTGRPPLEGGELIHLIARVLNETPKPLHEVNPKIPRGLSRVVARCLAKSRNARYADYAALRKALTPWAPGAASPATLARRTGAGVLDWIVLFVLLDSPVGLLIPGYANAGELATRTSDAVAAFLGYYALTILYYAICEGLWAATPGKALHGLRVIGESGFPPGFARSLFRSLTFNALGYLPPIALLSVVSSGDYIADPGPWDILRLLFWAALNIAFFATIRRRNGFAAVHDLITGTRVVGRHVPDDRQIWVTHPSAELVEGPPARDPRTVEEEARYGPYVVSHQVGERPGERILLGEDPVLRRKIAIVEGADPRSASSRARRELARGARLRWLAHDSDGARSWDAFELPEGAPFLGNRQLPATWPTLRGWLHQIAVELNHSMTDPTTAVVPSLDYLWITRTGRVLILDFPAPGAPVVHSRVVDEVREPRGIQHFLYKVAISAMGLDRDAGSTRSRRPIPLHAHEFLEKLREGSFRDMEGVLSALKALEQRPSSLSGARLGAVAFQLLWIGPWFFFLLEAPTSDEWRMAHPRLASPEALAEIHQRAAVARPDVQLAVERVLSGRYRSILTDSVFWADSSLVSEIGFQGFRPVVDLAIARPGPTPQQLAEADGILAPHLMRHSTEFAVIILTISVVFVGIVSLFVAAVFGRAPLLALFGICVIDRSRGRASRARLVWRSFLGTTLALVTVVSVLYALSGVAELVAASFPPVRFLPAPVADIPHIVLAVAIYVLGLLAIALRSPARAPQDYLARTWLVRF